MENLYFSATGPHERHFVWKKPHLYVVAVQHFMSSCLFGANVCIVWFVLVRRHGAVCCGAEQRGASRCVAVRFAELRRGTRCGAVRGGVAVSSACVLTTM